MKTFKTKFYPDSFTQEYCKRAFGVRRCIWNWALNESINIRKAVSKRPGPYALDKSYRQYLKTQKDSCFVWLAEQQTSPRLMQEVLQQLDESFKLAVQKKGRNSSPHYKTRKDREQTFSARLSMPYELRVEADHTISFSAAGYGKRGHGRTRESLAFLRNAKICSYTIKKDAGDYWICINYEKPNRKMQPKLNGKLGIDLGVVKSVCSFDGAKYSDVSFNTKHSLKFDRLSKKNDEKLSRQHYGSKRYEKQLLLKQKRAARAARCRNDELENYTTYLTQTYAKIVVDDFTFKGALNVSNHENAYRCMKYQFKLRLEQKAKESGTIVEFVQHQKGVKTTHKCSDCGSEHVHTTSTRQFHCLDCGYLSDRDENAARNAYLLA